MSFDATFWVAISFFIFVGLLVYFKIPQNINSLLTKMIGDIKKEIDTMLDFVSEYFNFQGFLISFN